MSKRKKKPQTRIIHVGDPVLPRIDGLTLNLKTDLRGQILPGTRFVRAEIIIPRYNGTHDVYTQTFQVKHS